jgi:two-component system, LytTR family, response regulator
MRVLIVDDEKPARERLRRLLSAFPDLQCVGEAVDAHEALAQVATLQPDVVFLDVQMPGPSGLVVAASLPEPAPAVVFVTAHEHYAVQAFDAAAIDYLLKPVEPERLLRTVQRLRAGGMAESRLARLPARLPASQVPPAQLLIADRGRTHVISVASIGWLEAADNYVVVHTAEQAPLMRRTLTGLLHDLGDGFLRTHRRAAVALTHVEQLQSRGKGDCWVTIKGGTRVPCSRQYRADLVARLDSGRLDSRPLL